MANIPRRSTSGIAGLARCLWKYLCSRGPTIGAALLREAIDFAKRTGAATLRLGVAVADSPAMRLYRTRGFAPVGAKEPLREGSTIWAQTMHLQLDVAA